MTKELREMSYDQLVEYSAQVMKEVRRRAYGEGYRQGKFDAEVTNEQTKETSQQARDRIVEQAKKDVEVLKDEYDGLYVVSNPVSKFHPYVCSAEYIVNKDKRTIVALLRGKHSSKVRAKGIAKCAPDDCFNVHIGKAIALRRALGLDVPAEYLNAPQPTEVRVGDVINYKEEKRIVIVDDELYVNPMTTHTCISTARTTAHIIIDDSREV